MGCKKTPGLTKIGEIWHIDKRIIGRRLCESCRTSDLVEAEAYLTKRTEEIRKATLYGERPIRTFRMAATKYLQENMHKASIGVDAMHLRHMDPYVGDLRLDQIHDGTLAAFIEVKKKAGNRGKSINNALGVVRHILNLAARSWRDEYGITWLDTPPLITMRTPQDSAKPYPLTWEEQNRLFAELPAHLGRMCLYKVNTGTRDQEVCKLRWDWEYQAEEIGRSVFVIPATFVKNREDRLVILNDVAWDVVNSVRGQHDDFVFTYRGNPVGSIHNSAWKRAWRAAGLPTDREWTKGVHNLKHTYGRRLRAAGVGFEDRQDLLGHKNGRITTHYSAAELGHLLECANSVCDNSSRKTTELTLIRVKRNAANSR
jgi:integrase